MPIGPGFDANQVIEASFNDTLQALNVSNLTGTLVPEVYDNVAFTYVDSGNGAGDISTMIFKLSTLVVATLNFTYDSSNRVTSVIRS